MNPTSVLLTTEGTYPCYGGGVSVWCDQLVSGLREVDFHVFAITHSPSQPVQYSLPKNVRNCRTFPLWGTDEPGSQDDFLPTFVRKLRTTSDAIHTHFVDPFRTALDCLLRPDADPEVLATALLRLHTYFQHYDYAQTMASEETWNEYLQICSAIPQVEQALSLQDATTCMRWLQRYLAVLSVPLPNVDITHASIAGLAAIPGVLLKLSRRVPFLLTEHGIYLRELYIYLSRAPHSLACKRFLISLNRALVGMIYHYADQVTCLCDFNYRWQIQFGVDAKKVITVPNGGDPAVFSPRSGTSSRPPTVLTMARIFPLKGVDVLLRAAPLVRLRIPNVRFKILGEASDKQYLALCLDLVRDLELDSCIEFGVCSKPAEAYPECDVFCLPSISEGMPFSIIEAMLSGCPVVATDVGGVAELLGGTGLLVTPGDSDGLTEALLNVLEDTPAATDRRHALAAAGLARAREFYTHGACGQRFREIYQRLATQDHDANLPQPRSSREFALAAAGRS